MSHQQIIEQALSEIGLAEALVDQAKIKYYSARKKLEGIYSPASPKKGELTNEERAGIISRMNESMFKPRKQKIS